MRVANGVLFTAADMSQASLSSSPIQLFNCFGYAIQLIFTGSPVGSVSVYVSCDPCNEGGVAVPAPSNFTLLASSTTAISAAGDIMYNINDCNYNWFKVVYTKTSGTGSLSGRFNLKGF